MLSLLLFLFLHAFPGKAQPGCDEGTKMVSSIAPYTPLLSPSRYFAFGFHREGDDGNGFAIGTWAAAEPDKVIWTWNRDNQPVISTAATLKLDHKGLHLLQWDRDDQHIFSVPDDSPDAARAALLDSGNFQICNYKGEVMWQTLDYPTDTIVVNQSLATGEELVSSLSDTNHSSGRFRMKMQNDGNLVMYPVNTLDAPTDAYWPNTTTPKLRPLSLFLDVNGNLSLTSFCGCFSDDYLFSNKHPTENLPAVYFARFEPDGVLRLYSLDGKGAKLLHQIPSGEEKCNIKGVCGMNSYCEASAGGVKCLCLPGFDYVDNNRKVAGCQRNFSEKAVCPEGDGDPPYYSMSKLLSTTWLDDPYQSSQPSSEEACREGCLKRCDCYAALFDPVQSRCSKQRPPLRYARTGKDVNTTALLKVGTPRLPTEEFAQVVKHGEPSSSLLAILAAVICVLPVAAAPIVFFSCQNRVNKCRKLWAMMEMSKEKKMAPESFTFLQLAKATRDFTDKLIGRDGAAFRGKLSAVGKEGAARSNVDVAQGATECNVNAAKGAAECEGEVAVQRFDKMGKKGDSMFRAAMRVAGRTYHRNLVQLVGFCNEGSNRLLVYEHMTGSLADLVLDRNISPPCWDKRVGIIFDVARAIRYLHEECEIPIIHCNINAQTILLDETGSAKLSDFGNAKLLMNPTTPKQGGGAGGSSNASISTPSEHERSKDVYSFGKVLLEIVCCRSLKEGEQDWNSLIEMDLKEFIPPGVEMQKVERMVKVGLHCFRKKPTMKEVMEILEGDREVPPCDLADPSLASQV